MLGAIASMYHVSHNILGTAVVTAIIGVRQGAPTSCFQFTMVVNDLIRSIKQQCQNDGILQWLHILMLMDDTVILATERTQCIQKVNILCEFCKTSGIVINESNTNLWLCMAQQAISLHCKHNQATYL